MDWKAIMGSVIGAIILGALAFVFNTLGELKHNDDVQNTKMDQIESEQRDVWSKYNKNEEEEKRAMTEFYHFQIEYYKDQREFWKDKAKK